MSQKENGYITHVDLYSGGKLVEKFIVDKCPYIGDNSVTLNKETEHWRWEESAKEWNKLNTHGQNDHVVISGTYVIWFEGT